MKHWQEKIPTFNLLLINLILFILIILAFIVGPVNLMSKDKNDVLNILKQKFNIVNCSNIDYYKFDKDMYTAQCVVNELDSYLFLDKNGIIYKRLSVDPIKEQQDYSTLIENMNMKDATYSVIYYKDKLAYWIKSNKFEYVIDYENLETLMKVSY